MRNRSKHTYCASLFFLILILLFGSSCLLTGCSGGTSSTAEANADNSVSSRADGSGNSGSDAEAPAQMQTVPAKNVPMPMPLLFPPHPVRHAMVMTAFPLTPPIFPMDM